MGKKAQLKCKIEAAANVWQEMSVCSSLIISLNSKLGSGWHCISHQVLGIFSRVQNQNRSPHSHAR